MWNGVPRLKEAGPQRSCSKKLHVRHKSNQEISIEVYLYLLNRIDRDYTVKVADFGLTRDIYQKDYYRQNSRKQVPVKWMAPESLLDHISSEKTDVVWALIRIWITSLFMLHYPASYHVVVIWSDVLGGVQSRPSALSNNRELRGS